MNILYYGFNGVLGNPVWGSILLLLIVFFVIVSIVEIREKDKFGGILFACLAFILIFPVVAAYSDNRTPIVKATLNSDAPYVEINNKYKLIDQEGEIYTFKVLNTTNEEWEAVVEEHKCLSILIILAQLNIMCGPVLCAAAQILIIIEKVMRANAMEKFILSKAQNTILNVIDAVLKSIVA